MVDVSITNCVTGQGRAKGQAAQVTGYAADLVLAKKTNRYKNLCRENAMESCWFVAETTGGRHNPPSTSSSASPSTTPSTSTSIDSQPATPQMLSQAADTANGSKPFPSPAPKPTQTDSGAPRPRQLPTPQSRVTTLPPSSPSFN